MSQKLFSRHKLTREEAIEELNKLKGLVCVTRIRFKLDPKKPTIVQSDYELMVGNKKHKFDAKTLVWDPGSGQYVQSSQPFQILARITREEFQQLAPDAFAPTSAMYYFYRIGTD